MRSYAVGPSLVSLHNPRSDYASSDDALQSLAPSLEPFKGCDILDIFPGLGLWSSKVHDLLKPRCHTLVDITQDGFAPFLQTLVEQPNSRYQYKTFDIIPTGRNRRRAAYKDPSITNQLKADSPGDAEWPLLILATCTAHPFAQVSYQGSEKTQRRNKKENLTKNIPLDQSPSEDLLFELMQHTTALAEHSIRPVRILLWTHDRDKINFLPRTVAGRKVAAFRNEEFFTTQEVVGWSRPPINVQGTMRPAQFDIQSAYTVARSMKENNVTLPEDRRPPLHHDILEIMETITEAVKLERNLNELNTLTAKNALGLMSVSDNSKAARAIKRESKSITAITTSLEELVGGKRLAVRGKALDNVGIHILMIELERSIASGTATLPLIHSSDDAPGGFVVRSPGSEESFTLDDLSARCEDDLQTHRDDYLYAAQAVIDNYAAINRPSPLLVWDRRSSEPLECRPEDFYPQNRLALLDLQVRDRKPPLESYSYLAPKERSTSSIAALTFARRLLRSGEGYPLPAALDRIAHGCAEGILPACPSVTDPLRGGRMKQNLPHLRVRMLTQEHWAELVAAWYAWPFRKSDVELETEMGSSTIFRDFDYG